MPPCLSLCYMSHGCIFRVFFLRFQVGSATRAFELVVACLIGVFFFLTVGILDQNTASQAVSAQTIVVIASGFGIARALTTTGAASHLANVIHVVFAPGGQLYVHALYCYTAVLLYCCTAVLLYCCTAVLLYCCTAVLLYCFTDVLMY
jgi:di/tricarboxylate transporter